MVALMYKWLLLSFSLFPGRELTVPAAHPIFMSVTEIEHNAKDKTLEISCKIFTDDFEKTLRQQYSGAIDLIKPADKAAMDRIVSDYVTKHLQVNADGKNTVFKYVGYEVIEEGVFCYFQVDNIAAVKQLEVTDSVLYEYKDSQISIIHAIIAGNRKSTRLVNPETKASFSF